MVLGRKRAIDLSHQRILALFANPVQQSLLVLLAEELGVDGLLFDGRLEIKP